MSRLIDGEHLKRTFLHNSIYDGFNIWKHIDKEKSVDAVEVVRCKDCKFYIGSNEKCMLIDTRLHFYETDNTWVEDCFCCWGERKEQE